MCLEGYICFMEECLKSLDCEMIEVKGVIKEFRVGCVEIWIEVNDFWECIVVLEMKMKMIFLG